MDTSILPFLAVRGFLIAVVVYGLVKCVQIFIIAKSERQSTLYIAESFKGVAIISAIQIGVDCAMNFHLFTHVSMALVVGCMWRRRTILKEIENTREPKGLFCGYPKRSYKR